MVEIWQYGLLATILVVAVGYAGWHIYKTIQHANDPCYNCEGCHLKGLKERKKTECNKK
jgi:hypothetical protein